MFLCALNHFLLSTGIAISDELDQVDNNYTVVFIKLIYMLALQSRGNGSVNHHSAASLKLHQIKGMFQNFHLFDRAAQLFLWWWTHLMGVICESDTSVNVSSVSFSLAASVCILCFVWAPSFCPRLAPILSKHNSAVAAQVGDSQSDLEIMDLDERHTICFDRDFTFCLVQQYMSNVLGSQPRDFPSFLWDRAGNEY